MPNPITPKDRRDLRILMIAVPTLFIALFWGLWTVTPN